jgi:hypothetical protein
MMETAETRPCGIVGDDPRPGSGRVFPLWEIPTQRIKSRRATAVKQYFANRGLVIQEINQWESVVVRASGYKYSESILGNDCPQR